MLFLSKCEHTISQYEQDACMTSMLMHKWKTFWTFGFTMQGKLKCSHCEAISIVVQFNCGYYCGLIFSFLSPQDRDGNRTPGKQTEQINKVSLCQCRLHISTTQKETLTFILATATRSHFSRCHGEKIPYMFLYRGSVTQKMPLQVFVSLVLPF